MFNPDQVQAWHEKPLPERAARHSFQDRHLGSAELKFSAVDRSPRSGVEAGTLRKPVHLFGTPYDPSCLEGIENWPVRTLPTRILTLPGARIVGNGAVLSDDNELYLPEQASLLTQAAFIATNSYGQQGFLIDAHDGRVAIRFAQREAPRVLSAQCRVSLQYRARQLRLVHLSPTPAIAGPRGVGPGVRLLYQRRTDFLPPRSHRTPRSAAQAGVLGARGDGRSLQEHHRVSRGRCRGVHRPGHADSGAADGAARRGVTRPPRTRCMCPGP